MKNTEKLLINVKSKFNLKIVKTCINSLKINNLMYLTTERKKLISIARRRIYYLRSCSARSCYNNNHHLKIGRIFSAPNKMCTFLSLFNYSIFLETQVCFARRHKMAYDGYTVTRVSLEIHMVFRES